MTKYIVGVDEVGRGPIAGPVAVGALVFEVGEYARYKRGRLRLPRGTDSKKLSPQERETWFDTICMLREKGILNFAVSFVSEKTIDRHGLSYAIKKAISASLQKLALNPSECRVMLDGLLKAPTEFKNQETIIKGDEKESVIGLASIVAKVLRDRKLIKLGSKFPQWKFEVHKGYGTRDHYATIKKFGLSPIHRRSFLKDCP